MHNTHTHTLVLLCAGAICALPLALVRPDAGIKFSAHSNKSWRSPAPPILVRLTPRCRSASCAQFWAASSLKETRRRRRRRTKARSASLVGCGATRRARALASGLRGARAPQVATPHDTGPPICRLFRLLRLSAGLRAGPRAACGSGRGAGLRGAQRSKPRAHALAIVRRSRWQKY